MLLCVQPMRASAWGHGTPSQSPMNHQNMNRIPHPGISKGSFEGPGICVLSEEHLQRMMVSIVSVHFGRHAHVLQTSALCLHSAHRIRSDAHTRATGKAVKWHPKWWSCLELFRLFLCGTHTQCQLQTEEQLRTLLNPISIPTLWQFGQPTISKATFFAACP